MIEFDNLKNMLNSYSSIIISAHVNPDGDAVASCTALSMALKKIGKNVVVMLEDYGDKYNFLDSHDFILYDTTKPNDFKTEMDNRAKLFISLDCGDKSRLGALESLFDMADMTMNIDHHISNTMFAKYNYVLESSSTCEIVYELLVYLDIELDKDIAKALYSGMLFDTGGFKHSNTTSRTHQIISELIKYEFSPSTIYHELFDICSYESAKLLGRALDKLELFFDRKVACSCITQEDMKEFNSDKSQLGNIVDHLKNIKDVVTAVFIYEKEDNQSKISMRCNGEIDICKIAVEFGGGGHFKACGCTVNARPEEAKILILTKIEEQIEKE